MEAYRYVMPLVLALSFLIFWYFFGRNPENLRFVTLEIKLDIPTLVFIIIIFVLIFIIIGFALIRATRYWY